MARPAGVKVCSQQVPAGFAALLRDWHVRREPRLDALLAAAYDNGWTLTALADVLGVSRERIRQRVARQRTAASLPDFPLPPRWPEPISKAKRRLELPASLADELRRMQAIAATVNGGMAVDNPARRVAEDLAAQLAALVDQGFTCYRLAQIIGVTANAVSHRLGRHGYRPLPPSQRDERYKRRKVGDVHHGQGDET